MHQRLVEENKFVTTVNIRNIYQGKNESKKTILKIFENHNIQMQKLVGKDYALEHRKDIKRPKDIYKII